MVVIIQHPFLKTGIFLYNNTIIPHTTHAVMVLAYIVFTFITFQGHMRYLHAFKNKLVYMSGYVHIHCTHTRTVCGSSACHAPHLACTHIRINVLRVFLLNTLCMSLLYYGNATLSV